MSRRIFLFTSTIAQAPDVVCFPDHTKGLGTLGSSAHTGQLARRVARFMSSLSRRCSRIGASKTPRWGMVECRFFGRVLLKGGDHEKGAIEQVA